MIIVAGTFRVPADQLDALTPHAEAMMKATRAEDGCVTYAFSRDIMEPGLIRVFEIWQSRPQLDAHMQVPHMKAWRAALSELGASGRDIKIYQSDEGVQL